VSGNSLHGVLPVDKPSGVTSHDVVAAARRALGERRIGHTGTLDPFASGLLLLCVGEATRLAEYLTAEEKRYDATVRLGAATDSGDLDGDVLSTCEKWRDVTPEILEAALSELRGAREQLPPSLSAKKVAGIPAHRRVRRGEQVVLSARPVVVHELEATTFELPEVRLKIRCSSGTYVRALARDLGERLGVGAHLTALRRTAIGRFAVDRAIGLERLGDAQSVAEALLSPLRALGHLPRLEVGAEASEDLGHGRSVAVPGESDTSVAVTACGNRLVAVGAVEEGRFRPRKVLAHG
jgi:tRNA pseudouridine55 synthase